MPGWLVTIVLWLVDKIPAFVRRLLTKKKPADGYEVIRNANEAASKVNPDDEAAADDPDNIDRGRR